MGAFLKKIVQNTPVCGGDPYFAECLLYMSRLQTISFIQQIAKTANAFEQLETNVYSLSREGLGIELLHCGIIPEAYAHDSSEEKLWAKYCDILLAKTLTHLDIPAEVLRARGNSADVFAKADSYTLVGDAKAFRLSRTAKNQKDFKIGALDDWRRQNTFACLIAPLYQFPVKQSQIYRQAITRNVTLLSYLHLKFMLDHPPQNSWVSLWQTPQTITPSDSAIEYWRAIDGVILATTGQSFEVLKAYQQSEIAQTRAIGQEGITHWQGVAETYRTLSREEAIETLIKSQKIEEKIATIKRMIARDVVI
jgi:hypothetical protein